MRDRRGPTKTYQAIQGLFMGAVISWEKYGFVHPVIRAGLIRWTGWTIPHMNAEVKKFIVEQTEEEWNRTTIGKPRLSSTASS